MKNLAYLCFSLAGISVALFFLVASYYLVVQVPKYEKIWYQASDGWDNVSHSINKLIGPMHQISQDVHELKAITANVPGLMSNMDQSMQSMNQSVAQIPPQLDSLAYDVHQMQRNIDYRPNKMMNRMLP